MRNKTFFLCDQTKCRNCQYPTCKHTTNPFYAKHFHMKSGAFFEDDNRDAEEAMRKAYYDVIFVIDDIKERYEHDEEKLKVIIELEDRIKGYLHR